MDSSLDGLARALAAWDADDSSVSDSHWEPAVIPASEVLTGLADSVDHVLSGSRSGLMGDQSRLVVVAKAPHAGSELTIRALIARCIAFGAEIGRIERLDKSEAQNVAHALYPDVWTHFMRPPAGDGLWGRIEAKFNVPEFSPIFGRRFDRSMVREGQRVCRENSISLAEFAAVWETGRHPIEREIVEARYGSEAARTIFPTDATKCDWYRCPQPFGIQKLASSTMAFALRHESLYNGAPTIVINGQFALLSRLFEYDDHGAVVLEVLLPARRSVAQFRRLVVGHSDVPGSCRKGSIRRDAADGYFPLDSPSAPVTPWANVVHASDGYLSGIVESAALMGIRGDSVLEDLLESRGYDAIEIQSLVSSDPVVVSGLGDSRLTTMTKALSVDDCIDVIASRLPPLRMPTAAKRQSIDALFGMACSPCPEAHLDRSAPLPDDRSPTEIVRYGSLRSELRQRGQSAIREGRVGLLVPLAGSGGRFGGYDLPEGAKGRLKPLLRLFTGPNGPLSALDIRGGHVRAIQRSDGTKIPMFLSCSNNTRSAVAAWVEDNRDLVASIANVPEYFRIRARGEGLGGYESRWDALSCVLRDGSGLPMQKPIGSIGLLWSLYTSGTLRSWIGQGIQFVLVSNADDVGFRIDPRILGILIDDVSTNCVVLAVSPVGRRWSESFKGGIVRERALGKGVGRSVYVLENSSLSVVGGEWVNTNQIYFRARPLLEALDALANSSAAPLPYYVESKSVRTDSGDVRAWHVYQPFADILRVIDGVLAVEIDEGGGGGQAGGYCPLKYSTDVERAQKLLDRLNEIDDAAVSVSSRAEVAE